MTNMTASLAVPTSPSQANEVNESSPSRVSTPLSRPLFGS